MLPKVILKPIQIMITWTPISEIERDFEISKFDENEILHHLAVQKLPHLTHLLDLVLFFCALKIMFCNLGSTTNFKFFQVFSTPLRGG